MTTMKRLIEAFEECEGVTLPKHWEVCHACDGKGIMTLKRIAISAEEFYEDPDFQDDYWNGVYDEPCDECDGRTTVQEVDLEHLDPDIRREWEEWLRSDAETEAIYAMERRMGA